MTASLAESTPQVPLSSGREADLLLCLLHHLKSAEATAAPRLDCFHPVINELNSPCFHMGLVALQFHVRLGLIRSIGLLLSGRSVLLAPLQRGRKWRRTFYVIET